MNKMKRNDLLNSITASKGQNPPNFKYKFIYTNFAKLYKEPNLYLLFEEKDDNRNENDYPFIKELNDFCNDENKIKETQPS